MTNTFIIAGTDTDVGKTVFSAMLMMGIGAAYWKPVQCGVAGGVDTKTVQKLTELPAERFLPEQYILTEPLSPHRAAELDGVEIDVSNLDVPSYDGWVLIETAGGLNVPLTRTTLFIDILEQWKIPVILCCRTGLGTINHSLLSIEALKKRNIPLHGLAFIGDENPDNMRTIAEFSDVHVLGRLPWLDKLDASGLKKAFDENFDVEDFAR